MSAAGKTNSTVLTEGPSRAAARAMLRGVGFTRDDLAKPIIGIANTWTETMNCNYNLRQLAARIKDGVRAAGGTPSLTCTASLRRLRLQGIVSVQVLAIPMIGLRRSSSE